MKRLRELLAITGLWPVWIAALAALILLPRLGSFGFWEPQEISIAEAARKRLDTESVSPETPGTDADAAVATGKAPPPNKSQKRGNPRLTDDVVRASLATFGTSEWGARAGLALMGLALILLTYVLGSQVRGAKGGAWSALILLSFPLFIFETRQVLSDIATTAGATLTMTGAIALLWPARRHWLGQGAAACGLCLGLWMSFAGGGLLIGIIPVAGAIAVAATTSLLRQGRPEERTGSRRLAFIGAGIAWLAAAAALAWLVRDVFDFTTSTGSRSLLGQAFEPTKDYVVSLGGQWNPNTAKTKTFNSVFEQIAFGCLPWVAFAPIAVPWLAARKRSWREDSAGVAVATWAVLSWFCATVFSRKVGPTYYAAMPALAVCVSALVLELGARRRGPRWPLLALFVGFAVVVLGRDVAQFPETFTAVHVLTGKLTYPDGFTLHRVVLLACVVFAGTAVVGMSLPELRPKWMPPSVQRAFNAVRTHGLAIALGISLVFATFLSQIWLPELAHKFSSRSTFDRLDSIRKPGEPVGLLGPTADGPAFYAKGDLEKLRTRTDLYEFLNRPGRAFALVPTADLCGIHAARHTSKFDYHVLDDRNAKYLLVSNKLDEGESDKNHVADAMRSAPPKSVDHELSVNFDDKIELIGFDIPDAVGRGDKFKLTLHFKVLKRISRDWKVFVHFDGGGQRFQGDHHPREMFCATNYWRPGDYVVDTVEVDAGGMTFGKGKYQVWLGFFVGAAGNWTNMKVVTGDSDKNNRVRIGNITLR